jgi:hypothetical protein
MTENSDEGRLDEGTIARFKLARLALFVGSVTYLKMQKESKDSIVQWETKEGQYKHNKTER